MNENPTMLVAMRRNRQLRSGAAVIQALCDAANQPVSLVLVEPEKTLELEKSILRIVKNEMGSLRRDSDLSWPEVVSKFEDYLCQTHSQSYLVLLCSKPEFSFTVSKRDIAFVFEASLNEDGETIYIVETLNCGYGFGIDRYEEDGEILFESDLFKFDSSKTQR